MLFKTFDPNDAAVMCFIQANILILGPVGAGKSSFYNTINAGFQGRITVKAISGSGPRSVTTEVGL